MCGISGIIELNHFDKQNMACNIKLMTDFMYHRGPDGGGTFIKNNVALGHRRLSIIDIAGGKQPFVSECGRFALTFNGEIYNYIELRESLVKKGYTFKTKSDTEVLLYALIAYKENVLEKLNGMFAFCFIDFQEKTALLARDHLGVKPLFYFYDHNRLLFASDVGAIACHSHFPKVINHKAISHYFTWRVIPSPYSPFEKTYQVKPGHFIKLNLNNRELQEKMYWDIPLFQETEKKSPKLFEEELSALLADALKLQVRSDVPVGAFLSGGVDSSTLAYWMGQVQEKPLTFTVGFKEKIFDESKWAGDVAKYLDTNHHLDIIEHYSLDKEFEKIIYYFNQPNGTGTPNYFVSELGRRHAKVALSGVGGDELFAGYPRFNFGLQDSLHAEDLFLKSLTSFKLADKQKFFSADFFEGVKDEPSLNFIKKQYQHKTSNEAVNKLCYLDLKHFMLNDLLFNLDKMSMAHSLEVRVPILDYRIVEFAMSVPPQLKIRPGLQKILLKRVMYNKLPSHVFLRRKKGFSLPKQFWVKKMENYIRDTLSQSSLNNHGILDFNNVSKQLDTVFSKDEISWKEANDIWNMISFEKWADMFVDNEPPIIKANTGKALIDEGVY